MSNKPSQSMQDAIQKFKDVKSGKLKVVAPTPPQGLRLTNYGAESELTPEQIAKNVEVAKYVGQVKTVRV